MSTRDHLYRGLRVANDLRAIRRGRILRRILRRIYGRLTGRAARRLIP